jgi:hypothetical protein
VRRPFLIWVTISFVFVAVSSADAQTRKEKLAQRRAEKAKADAAAGIPPKARGLNNPNSVSAKLEARITATPDGGTLDLTGETFHVDMDPINVEGRKNLTIVGGTIIRAKTEKGNHHSGRIFNFKLCDHLTLRNITVIGSKKQHIGYQVRSEGFHAFAFAACSNVLCDRLVAQHIQGDGMYFSSVGGAKESVPCKNVTVRAFDLFDSGRHGIALTGIDGILITDNTRLRGFQRKAIDREDRVASDVRLNITVDASTYRCSAKKLALGECK